jgi:FtsH-binding integral membrane protein
MADFDNRVLRGQAGTVESFDAGLRSYMLRVYNYMLVAMLVTGVAAYGVFQLSVTNDPAQAAATLRGGLMLTNIGVALFTSPLRWVVIFAPLGAVLLLQYRLRSVSAGGAQAMFWVFSALMGLSMASIFLVYTQANIAMTFFITAAAFGGLSLYGYTTTRSLSGIGSFLIMGVWGLLIAMVVNIFLQSPMIMWVVSVAGVGIFAGLTAYDTQSIKEMYSVNDDGTMAGRKAILGALRLYLDFINMFQFLLYLTGGSRR